MMTALLNGHLAYLAPRVPCGATAAPRASVALAARGPSTSEVIRRLKSLGVDTSNVYEKRELLRLLEVVEAQQPPASSTQAPPDGPPPTPIGEMDLQDIMYELEERGVDFDVLAPEPALITLLKKARRESCLLYTSPSPRDS